MVIRAPSRDFERGFTLIELLVVIAIIGVLIALLLPAGYNDRSEFNQESAKQALTFAWPCVEAFQSRTGRLPNTMLEIDPDCMDLAGLSTPIQQGYQFSIDASAGVPWSMRAEPVHPGITGLLTFVLNAPGDVTEFPTAGADEVRQKVLEGLLLAGARAAVDLLRLDERGASSHPALRLRSGDQARDPAAARCERQRRARIPGAARVRSRCRGRSARPRTPPTPEPLPGEPLPSGWTEPGCRHRPRRVDR